MLEKDLIDTKSLVARLGVQKNWTGSRAMFNHSDYRYVMRDKAKILAIVETKVLRKDAAVLNFIFPDNKHKSVGIINALIQQVMINIPLKEIYFSVHLADKVLYNNVQALGFVMITDKIILNKNKLPMDGLHVSFFRKWR